MLRLLVCSHNPGVSRVFSTFLIGLGRLFPLPKKEKVAFYSVWFGLATVV